MTKITKTDQEMLTLLKANARIPITELARRLGLARSTVQARLERLENAKIIAGYGVRMGQAHEANLIHATILAELASGATTQLMKQIKELSEIERVNTTAGRFDLIIELQVPHLSRLDEIIERLEEIDGFERSESLVHLTSKLDRRI